MEALLIFAALMVGLPLFICIKLGESRGRTGWIWGLVLGWLGVLILACMKPIPVHQRIADRQADEQAMLAQRRHLMTPENPQGIWPPPPPHR